MYLFAVIATAKILHQKDTTRPKHKKKNEKSLFFLFIASLFIGALLRLMVYRFAVYKRGSAAINL